MMRTAAVRGRGGLPFARGPAGHPFPSKRGPHWERFQAAAPEDEDLQEPPEAPPAPPTPVRPPHHHRPPAPASWGQPPAYELVRVRPAPRLCEAVVEEAHPRAPASEPPPPPPPPPPRRRWAASLYRWMTVYVPVLLVVAVILYVLSDLFMKTLAMRTVQALTRNLPEVPRPRTALPLATSPPRPPTPPMAATAPGPPPPPPPNPAVLPANALMLASNRLFGDMSSNSLDELRSNQRITTPAGLMFR